MESLIPSPTNFAPFLRTTLRFYSSADISRFEDEAHFSSHVPTSLPVSVQIWLSLWLKFCSNVQAHWAAQLCPCYLVTGNTLYPVLPFTSCQAIREHQSLIFLTLLNKMCPSLGYLGNLASNSSIDPP